MTGMKFSFTNLGCPAWDLEHMAAKASEYGFDGVELRSHSDSPYMYPNPPLSYRRHVKDLFNKHNLEISAVSAYSRFADTSEEALDKNRQILVDDIILARDLGANVVRSFLGENKNMTHAEILDAASPYLNYCGDFAAACGVTVAFETHDAWCGSALMEQVFERITSPGMAILWDVGNNCFAGEDVHTFYDTVGSRCVHLHLKDGYVDDKGDIIETLPGDGKVPMKDCLEMLYHSNFGGYVSFEWEKHWHPELPEPEVAFPRFMSAVKKIMKELGA